jgi:hypothetical protein
MIAIWDAKGKETVTEETLYSKAATSVESFDEMMKKLKAAV